MMIPEEERALRKVASSTGYGSMEQRENSDPRLHRESVSFKGLTKFTFHLAVHN
jgi:hypothetical protein